ncbi:DUF2397 family protein [Fodinicola feengrottensis]|uniref:DUF2397 family protein n=1 Tax=Fodinicola feengrottensis TaxID=435914 RepID=UPI0024423504|nr:DUF2397 family protein [Fodinicola feengrottensis]
MNTAKKATVGVRAKKLDYSAGRAAARRTRAATAAARAEAEASLRGRSGTQLAGWAELSEPELDLLVELLGSRARESPGQSARVGVTGDGRWRVTLTPADSGSGSAVVPSPRGRLVTVNWYFELDSAR